MSISNWDTLKWIEGLQSIGSKYFVIAGVSFVIFYVLFKKHFIQLRIQKQFPRRKQYWRDVLYSAVAMGIIGSVVYVTFIVLRPYNNVHYGSIIEYGWGYFCLSLIWMYFLHDTYFYWLHRFMHIPILFKHIHLVHHKSTNPSPWTAYAFHPLEALMESGIVPLIAFTLPVNRVAFSVFMLFQLTYNVYGHLGYELLSSPIRKSLPGRYLNTSTHHNFHHRWFVGNYGLYTVIWDRLMNTFKESEDT